jgi:hypothetical protein
LALLPLALIIAADANAARYVATPTGGGRIALNVTDGRLQRVKAALPPSKQYLSPKRLMERFDEPSCHP